VTGILEAFVDMIESQPGFPWILGWIVLGSLVVMVIHEAGHLLAALWTGQREMALHIGSYGTLMERRLGELTVHANALISPWRVAGSVTFDAAHTTVRAMAIIALAGPAASFVGAATTGLLASSLGTAFLSEFFAMTTFMGLSAGLGNLIPLTVVEGTRRRPGARRHSDGRHALRALRVMHELRGG
jgi:hypothetical protein